MVSRFLEQVQLSLLIPLNLTERRLSFRDQATHVQQMVQELQQELTFTMSGMHRMQQQQQVMISMPTVVLQREMQQMLLHVSGQQTSLQELLPSQLTLQYQALVQQAVLLRQQILRTQQQRLQLILILTMRAGASMRLSMLTQQSQAMAHTQYP